MLELTDAQIDAGLGAMKAVAAANGRFDDLERSALVAAGSIVGRAVDPDAVIEAPPADVAELFRGDLAEHLIHALVVMAVIDGALTAEETRCVRSYADALGVADPHVRELEWIERGWLAIAKADLARRMPIIDDIVAARWKARGLGGIVDLVSEFRGTYQNHEMALRFRRLGLLPEGTLGREFWAHMTREGFSFPGEPGGIALEATHHDVTHILTGYLTDPEGESQIAAFYAGMIGKRAFPLVLGTMLMFQMGIQLSPIATPAKGKVDPQKVARAMERGAKMKVNLAEGWDFWPLMELPLADARAAVGLA
jgi:hypothetical protein